MDVDSTTLELRKRAAASRALDFVVSGMVLGLGTGSTSWWFVKLLSERIIKDNLEVSCVPTSTSTRDHANSLKIPITSLEKVKVIDLTVDGADEFDHNLNLIKGGGGALLQEKIVAAASKRMVVITDVSKESSCLGSFDLPVEIIKFGATSTVSLIGEILSKVGYQDVEVQYRKQNGNKKFVTDEGHFIVDLKLKVIKDAELLHKQLIGCPGVVETGLFCGFANTIIVGKEDGSCKLIGAL